MDAAESIEQRRPPAQIDPAGVAMADRLLTAADVAELLQVPTSWVHAEARAGRLPHVSIGRYRRFRRESIDAWIRERERGPLPSRRPGGGPGGS